MAMYKRGFWKYSYSSALLSVVLALCMSVSTVIAVTSSSSNYQITDAEFSSGATVGSCSSQYCAQVSIGDTAGNTSTATFSDMTGDEPFIEVILEAGTSGLGVLSATTTATKETIVKVRSHLAGGYGLHILGDPPKHSGHTLRAAAVAAQSQPGVEQFGINVVANTIPLLGKDPLQLSEGLIGFGVASEGYDTPNYFKYVNGEEIAHSTTESGRTDYTISMIINVANSTPAGHYFGDFAVIIVPTY